MSSQKDSSSLWLQPYRIQGMCLLVSLVSIPLFFRHEAPTNNSIRELILVGIQSYLNRYAYYDGIYYTFCILVPKLLTRVALYSEYSMHSSLVVITKSCIRMCIVTFRNASLRRINEQRTEISDPTF